MVYIKNEFPEYFRNRRHPHIFEKGLIEIYSLGLSAEFVLWLFILVSGGTSKKRHLKVSFSDLNYFNFNNTILQLQIYL